MQVIEMMRPGQTPDEPGWYVIEGHTERFVSQIVEDRGYFWFEPSRLRVLSTDRFIARLHLDRVGDIDPPALGIEARSAETAGFGP